MLVLGVSAVAMTGSASAETLQDALVSTYDSNPQLLAERARLRATDENVAQAVSGWRPTVTVSGSAGWSHSETEVGALSTEDGDRTWSGNVTATQPIFQGGKTLASVRQARASVRAGRAQLTSTEQTVLLNAVTSYMDVVRDEAVVELSKNQLNVLQRQLQAARDRFEVGEITRTDVAQAEARVSLAQSQLTAAEAALTVSRSAYERVVGRLPTDLDEKPPLPKLPDAEATALDAARAANPVLIAQKESEIASDYAIDFAVGDLLPSVSLQARHGRGEENSAPGSRSETTEVVGVVSVPLYQGGFEYAEIRRTKQVHSQQRLLVAQTQRQIEEQVKNAWDALRSASATIVSDREQVRANEIALEGVEQEAQVGSRTTLDVLDATQELLNSQVALVRSQRNEVVAAYSLLATMGGLTAQNLELPVKLYDPEVNYDDVSGRWIGFGSED